MNLFDELKVKVREKHCTIVFPEGTDARVVGAAIRLKEEGLLEPIVLGTRAEVERAAEKAGKRLGELRTIDPAGYEESEELLRLFLERRKGKLEEPEARRLLEDYNYFGTLLVYAKKADGMVSGAIHSTADTVRPALQIVKVEPPYSKVSGLFILLKEHQVYFMADCAVNMNPTAEELAEIAKQSAESARAYVSEPKVAMLSFSTKGSAKSEDVDRVVEAVRIVKEKYPELAVDGELQFDAAISPEVAKLKAPGSEVAGAANVFVFPSLEAGNIGYKIAQRLGGWEAVGPLLQGLNAPVNDLSRGCNEEDVYKLAILTALQVK